MFQGFRHSFQGFGEYVLVKEQQQNISASSSGEGAKEEDAPHTPFEVQACHKEVVAGFPATVNSAVGINSRYARYFFVVYFPQTYHPALPTLPTPHPPPHPPPPLLTPSAATDVSPSMIWASSATYLKAWPSKSTVSCAVSGTGRRILLLVPVTTRFLALQVMPVQMLALLRLA
jgi:hypothetical protein